MKQQSVDSLTCPKCGRSNSCQSKLKGSFNCWCQNIKLSDENRAHIKELGLSADCLCQLCLDLLCKDSL